MAVKRKYAHINGMHSIAVDAHVHAVKRKYAHINGKDELFNRDGMHTRNGMHTSDRAIE